MGSSDRPPLPHPSGAPPGPAPGAGQAAGRAADAQAAKAVDWAAIAAACEREAILRQGREAALLLHQAGRIHEERLGNAEVALARFQAAAAADPAHLASLQAGRRLAHRRGDTSLEVAFLEAEARATADPRRSAALDHARARLLADLLEKGDEARALLADAAARDPANLALLADHGRLAAGAGRHDEVLADWLRAAEVAGDAAGAQILCAASQLAEEHLLQPDRAAELALAAFRRSPGDSAARALALRHAERLGRTEDRIALLEAEGRGASSSRAAALALLQLARIHEEGGRPEQALEVLAEAQRRSPGDPAVLAEWARFAEARGAWDELAQVLRARIEMLLASSAAPQELAAAQLQLAEVCAERLERPDEAAACYRSALAADPRSRAALAALGRHHAARGEWEHVLETFLAEREALDDPREQAQRCFKAGELLEERLGRPESALGLYTEALSLDPTLLAASRACERLLESLGRYPELCEHLERELAATAEPSQAIALHFRIARLREDRLGDLDGAADCYRKALAIDHEHLVALRSLSAVLERAGRPKDLAVALEHAAAVVKDQREAVALLTRAGEVRSEAGDEPGAAAAWERALAIDPSHLPALRALGRLCARAGRWEELVDMCRAEAQVLPSAEAAAALLVRVGEILEGRLERPAEATAAWREALTLSPAHPGALRSLARLHRSRGELEPLVEVLRAAADARVSPAERAALLYEVGEIWERRLGDGAMAVEVHQEALRADPGFAPSQRALQRLLAEQSRWLELGAACQIEAETCTGPERTAALLRLGWLAAERLGDDPGAAAAAREVLAADPGHAGAALLLDRLGLAAGPVARAGLAARVPAPEAARALWTAAALDRRLAGGDPRADLEKAAELDPADPVVGPELEEHLRASGRFSQLARVWEARQRLAAGAEKAECALRSGEAWEDAGEPERAQGAFERALSLAPGSLPALQALRRIRVRAGDWAEARLALRAEAAACQDPQVAATLLGQAADLALEPLGDRALAAEDLRQAAARDPANGAIGDRLVALLEDSRSPADSCDLREARGRAEAVPARAAEHWLAAARIASGRLGDLPRAIADAARALVLQPDWQEALLLRGRLLAAEGRAAEAARDLSACLAQGGDPEALAPVHLEMAAVAQGLLGDAPRAVSHLNAVLASRPDHPQALGRLARIHREARNWPAAADALRRLVASPGLPAEERLPRLLELAQVQADGAGNPAAAAELCEEALRIEPGHAAALDLLARAKELADDLPGLVGALDRAARQGQDPARRVSARLRAARILQDSLRDRERALAQLRLALEQDPSSLPAREALADFLALDSPEEAVEEHRRVLELEPWRAESWRALFQIFQRSRAHDRAFVAAGVLRFLQVADPSTDGALYAENAPHAPQRPSASLSEADWALVRDPVDRGPLSELLALVGPHLGELLAEPEVRATRVRSGHPVRRLVAELARNLGVDEPPLAEEAEGAGLALDPTPPGRIRVGAEFARRHTLPEQRFLLSRAVARMKAGSGLADHLGPGRLGEFLAAALRQAAAGWSGTGDPGEGLVRQVARVLPRRLRRPLGELAGRVGARRTDLIAWYASLSSTADRAGLLLGGDNPTALVLALRDGALAPPRPETGVEIREAIRARPDLQGMLRFAASEDYLALRQKLKMAIA